MRYSKMLNKFRCVMIHVDWFVLVTLRNGSYACVCRSYLNVNQSLQFAFIRYKISDSIATIRNYSLHFEQVRKLSQMICKLAGHNFITCDLKR